MVNSVFQNYSIYIKNHARYNREVWGERINGLGKTGGGVQQTF